jgi:hypothetical protein
LVRQRFYAAAISSYRRLLSATEMCPANFTGRA